MQPVKGKSHVPAGKGTESTVAPRKKNQSSGDKPVSLKILADHLGLCPATVSVVLNNVPGRSIPVETRERVRAAARKFNYQPSLLARSLRKQRTFTVGVLVPELSDGYHTLVMSGIGDHLMREGYFYFSALCVNVRFAWSRFGHRSSRSPETIPQSRGAYVGTHATRLHSNLVQTNSINPKFYSLGKKLNDPINSPEGQATLASLGIAEPSWFRPLFGDSEQLVVR